MTITLSRNEIRAEVEKALRGVGMDWGVAKDGGVMAAWMAAHNLAFLGGLNRCLEALDDTPDDAPACPGVDCIAPVAAITLAECVAATQTPWTGRVMMPRFLLAGIGIVAGEQGQVFHMMIEGRVLARADHNQLWVHPEGVSSADAVVTVSPGWGDEAEDGADLVVCPWAEAIAHTASPACWRTLGQYAYRTYVPETEEKRRAGAGAGDIDNS